MKKICFQLLLFAALFLGGENLAYSQDLTELQDLIVRAPGFDASKEMGNIKANADGSNGLYFVAYYAKSDLIHFRINRTHNADNSLIYSLFPDLTFTIIQDPEQTRQILNEQTQPKSQVPTPAIKHE